MHSSNIRDSYRNVTLTEIMSFHNKINRYINRFNILRINIIKKDIYVSQIYNIINLFIDLLILLREISIFVRV